MTDRIPQRRTAANPPPAGSRSERIVELARQGWTREAIAKELFITRGAVSSLLSYYGVSTGNPGGRPKKGLDEPLGAAQKESAPQ